MGNMQAVCSDSRLVCLLEAVRAVTAVEAAPRCSELTAQLHCLFLFAGLLPPLPKSLARCGAQVPPSVPDRWQHGSRRPTAAAEYSKAACCCFLMTRCTCYCN